MKINATKIFFLFKLFLLLEVASTNMLAQITSKCDINVFNVVAESEKLSQAKIIKNLITK